LRGAAYLTGGHGRALAIGAPQGRPQTHRPGRWRTTPGAQLPHPARRPRHTHPQYRPPRARSSYRHPRYPHLQPAPRPRSARHHAYRVDRPTSPTANDLNGLRSNEGKVRSSRAIASPSPIMGTHSLAVSAARPKRDRYEHRPPRQPASDELCTTLQPFGIDPHPDAKHQLVALVFGLDGLGRELRLAGNEHHLGRDYMSRIGIEHDAGLRAQSDPAGIGGLQVNVYVDIRSVEHCEDFAARREDFAHIGNA